MAAQSTEQLATTLHKLAMECYKGQVTTIINQATTAAEGGALHITVDKQPPPAVIAALAEMKFVCKDISEFTTDTGKIKTKISW